MQIPILNGIYTDETPDFRTSYPRNYVPVPKDQGISKGYLRPADGIEERGSGPGIDRGVINWNGVEYRVMGTNLVRIDSAGVATTLATIPGAGQVRFDYSFDRLAIAANGSLFYWNGTTLTHVTDPDLGTVVDMLWVDGYFLTTDGTALVVTELNDPTSVNPLKYGSSEADPDPVKGLRKVNNEPVALNRYTCEAFENVGGNNFPFQRIDGALLKRGPLGTFCSITMTVGVNEALVFLGSAKDESPAVWVGQNSTMAKISTREIDTILQEYTEAELALSVMEKRFDKSHQHLLLHLIDQTLVYDGAASQAIGDPVWFTLTSSIVGRGQYRARNLCWVYDAWRCGDPTTNKMGTLVDTVSTHYGDTIGWDFGTSIVYNNGMGAIFHELELVCLPGRVPLGADPVIWTSYSLDGETWSMERSCPAGKQGERTRRINWLQAGDMQHWRIQRFRGTSDAHLPVARLEAQMEPLNA